MNEWWRQCRTLVFITRGFVAVYRQWQRQLSRCELNHKIKTFEILTYHSICRQNLHKQSLVQMTIFQYVAKEDRQGSWSKTLSQLKTLSIIIHKLGQQQLVTSGQSNLTKVKVIWRKAASHPSWRRIHLFHAGDNATTAQPVDELICRHEGRGVTSRPAWPFPSKLPLPTGDLDLHLIHGSLGPPESSTQTASRSVQPFLQGSLVWQTDRQTDHATRSLTTGRIYVHTTAMRPNNAVFAHKFTNLNCRL